MKWQEDSDEEADENENIVKEVAKTRSTSRKSVTETPERTRKKSEPSSNKKPTRSASKKSEKIQVTASKNEKSNLRPRRSRTSYVEPSFEEDDFDSDDLFEPSDEGKEDSSEAEDSDVSSENSVDSSDAEEEDVKVQNRRSRRRPVAPVSIRFIIKHYIESSKSSEHVVKIDHSRRGDSM